MNIHELEFVAPEDMPGAHTSDHLSVRGGIQPGRYLVEPGGRKVPATATTAGYTGYPFLKDGILQIVLLSAVLN